MAAIQQMLLSAGSYTPPAFTYATWNPSDKSASVTLSGGNLTASVTTFASGGARATLSKSAGKWYWENVINSGTLTTRIGGANSSWGVGTAVGSDTNSVGYMWSDGKVYNNSTAIVTLSTAAVGDVMGVGLDMDNNQISFYKNGTLMGSPITIPAGTYFPVVSLPSTGSATSLTTNFGATTLAFSPPAGFNAGFYV